MDACPAVMNAFDMIRAHFWRAAALVLLVLFALQWAQSTRLDAELTQVRSALKIATSAIEVANDLQTASAASASQWEAVALDLRERLSATLERSRVQQEADAAALAAARAAERDADATLRLWLDRYAAAVREPECAAQMEQRLCVALD